MEQTDFRGVCTALVTPFCKTGIHWGMLERLIAFQEENGIQTLVLCGTTGEAATLSDSEKLSILRFAREKCHCRILMGTGSNCTEHAVALSVHAQQLGADGLLVVSPYYNKATESGLIAHYGAIAEATEIPVILYNVPSRTGVNIPVSVYQKLSKYSNIIGIKEASGNLHTVEKILQICPNLQVWSGNDDLTVPIISVGGSGVISVASNVLPKEMKIMTDAALHGDFRKAADMQIQLLDFMDAMFCEVNPIPVKYAMGLIGFDCGGCRLPLTELTPEHQNGLKKIIQGVSQTSTPCME